MKRAKKQLLICLFALAGLITANLVSHYGYFLSVETNSVSTGSDARILQQLQTLLAQLKNADEGDSAKKLVQLGESQMLPASSADAAQKYRQAFEPVLKVFSAKPRESSPRGLMRDKRDLMEGLVNAYRKEIPNGPIALRAAYLNILFDIQNSLVNEADEVEQIFLRRVKDRFAGLKDLGAKSGEAALNVRINGLDSIFQSYEKNFEALVKWKKDKAAVLAKTEKTFSALSGELRGNQDGRLEDTRRFFLYSSLFSLLIALLAVAGVCVFYKVSKLRHEARVGDFSRFLGTFGRERESAEEKQLAAGLAQDPNWDTVVASVLETEAKFIATYQTLISIPQSMLTPFLVFSRDGAIQHSNEAAQKIFQGNGKPFANLDQLLISGILSSREGNPEAVNHMIQNSFDSPKDDTFELFLKLDGANAPFELLSYPIVRGPLAGGKVYLFREIRNEILRVEQAVKVQLARVQETIHKISRNLPVEIKTLADDAEEVRLTLASLDSMKSHLEEQELRRKSEKEALMDQIQRQREILDRLSDHVLQVRGAQEKALGLVNGIHAQDENWHDEVRTLERDLEAWALLREKLEVELGRYAETMRKAKFYEEDLRSSTEKMESFLSGFQENLDELRSYADKARIHAVNMGFVSDPQQREVAASARAYAHEMAKFVDTATETAANLHLFVAQHPGSSLAPILSSAEFDAAALASFEKEEDRLSSFVKRWSDAGEGLLAEGTQALGILQESDKVIATISQLGETSRVINEQAEGNISRWS
jgi:hypothetical protein